MTSTTQWWLQGTTCASMLTCNWWFLISSAIVMPELWTKPYCIAVTNMCAACLDWFCVWWESVYLALSLSGCTSLYRPTCTSHVGISKVLVYWRFIADFCCYNCVHHTDSYGVSLIGHWPSISHSHLCFAYGLHFVFELCLSRLFIGDNIHSLVSKSHLHKLMTTQTTLPWWTYHVHESDP